MESEQSLDLGEDVTLDLPAAAEQSEGQKLRELMKANAQPAKHKGWPKGKLRKPLGISPAVSIEQPAEDESVEHNLIRRLLEAARARTQFSAIVPDQCVACQKVHQLGARLRGALECKCICHLARGWLREHKN